MRFPRKKRPQRTFRWEGYVLPPDENCWTQGDGICVSDGPCLHTKEPGPKTFWARVVPLDHKGPELDIEIEESKLPRARAGEYIIIHTYRKGRKKRTLLRRKKVPVWTEEELALIRARGKEWAERAKAWIQ